ncbi:MAG TPA: hypothetical protein PLQ78_03275 [Flavipsychrobacter sp.]|nr:hypothetical protein [Flavipsychrobacter sp.]
MTFDSNKVIHFEILNDYDFVELYNFDKTMLVEKNINNYLSLIVEKNVFV